MMRDRNISTFIACDHDYDESNIVLYGAPFDGTTSYRPGTRFASAAIRNESYGLETYSPYQDKDLSDCKIYDAGDMFFGYGNVERALDTIYHWTSEFLKDGKTPLMIGGEHLVTLGSVRAAFEKYPDLHIIHFDAHADLADKLFGEELSHGSVLRRCWDLVGDGRIYQFGIRSGSRDEFYWAKDHVHMQKFNFDGLSTVVERLKDKPVYVTIDLDVLDPSVFPGTGTPEAGGVTFTELLDALNKVFTLNIVAVDMNELSPVYDQSGASTALGCKLLRELLLLI